MMSKVIAFPEPKTRRLPPDAPTRGAVTLFVHVRRTTLIAHLSGRIPSFAAQDGRIGKK